MSMISNLDLIRRVPLFSLLTAEQAQTIARWRQAALQDEAGQALDQALVQHGAPARPVPEKPILWMKNPRTGRA